jgi:hypothetical protein
MMMVVDEELQAIADKKDANKVREAADETLTLDVNDCDDDVGSRADGIEIGLKLAAKSAEITEADCRYESESVQAHLF